jgi:NTE family protein
VQDSQGLAGRILAWDEEDRDRQAARPEVPLRVGVALGAGSAAAMAQIGALEVLSEAGIGLHSVAGTSAGALVGAACAARWLADLRDSLESLSRRRVLRLFDLAWPREGLLQGRRALEFVRPHLGEAIESLEIPYAAVATDLRSGAEVAISRGPVFDAVRASIAIPGIFTLAHRRATARRWRAGQPDSGVDRNRPRRGVRDRAERAAA